MNSTKFVRPEMPGFTPRTLELERELKERAKSLAEFESGDLSIEMRPGHDTLWCLIRRRGRGGIALRTARTPDR